MKSDLEDERPPDPGFVSPGTEAAAPRAPVPEPPTNGGLGGTFFHITVGPSSELLEALEAGARITGFGRPEPKGRP